MRFLAPLLLSTSLFCAPSGVYVEADIAGESAKNDAYTTDLGISASIALGYQLDKFRFELQARESLAELSGYEQTDTYKTSGDMRISSQFFNLYYSGYNKSKLVSTIGLGVGQSKVSFEDIVISSNAQDDVELKELLSYQASYSIGYMVNEDFSYVLKYNYLYIDNDKTDEFDSKNFQNHTFSIGLRYLF